LTVTAFRRDIMKLLPRWLLLATVTIGAVYGADDPKFDSAVLPILKTRCAGCHKGATAPAGLDLTSREGVLKGGRSGAAVQPGDSARSLLIERVTSRTMPPTDPKLTDAEITVLREWVDRSGANRIVTENDVLPIFQMRCVVCHGKRKQEGGLDLRSQASRMKGGKSGLAIVPGKPEESLLIQRIVSGQMPPPKLLVEYFVRPPNEAEVDLLRKWIAGGAQPAPPEAAEQSGDPLVTAKDRAFWSFQPPAKPVVPAVQHGDQVRNPIDAFLLQKLEAKNLHYSPEAARPALLRRAYLDLTGLPPSAAELDAWLADARPDAYERLIDKLLASPRYGERWGKFWLDAAGYSDSEGIIDEDMIRSEAWRYRDYVIRAFNSDKPYDQFLTEQIAGDELVDYKHATKATPDVLEKLTATGYLRMVPDGTYSPANGSVAERVNVISDEIEVLSSSVMGLTVGCARCHNHKYDPIPQRDYYRLAAILQSAYDPYDWVKPTERYLDFATDAEREETAKFNAPIESELKNLESSLETLARPWREKLKENAQDAGGINDEKLAERFPEFGKESATIRKSITAAKAKLKPPPRIRALYEMGGEPSPSYLLRRGEAQQPGERVQAGVPSVLKTGLADYHIVPPYADSSGRRLAFARWLVQPNHPLTARVMVNRLWMHHFGRGIVASASNFGRLGTPPSHPELLDWLATEFVARGWSIKAMQRLIMTSTAYRQSSSVVDANGADPDNVFLSHMPLRRMDAEQLHDSLLIVTGQLDLKAFGPPVRVEANPSGEVAATGNRKQGWRRAVYVLQRRTTPATMLEVFDLPPMSPNCIERAYSTVPTQALQMTNSAAVRDRARFLAARLIDQFPAATRESLNKQVEQVYLGALSRRPDPEEISEAAGQIAKLEQYWEQHLAEDKSDSPVASTARWYALADFCHAILSSADFEYID
jgi:HAMP domain-containing protein